MSSQFVSLLRDHQMTWTEFVYLFVYFWNLLESPGRICNWFWVKFELNLEFWDSKNYYSLALVHLIPFCLVWVEIECTVNVALQASPRWPSRLMRHYLADLEIIIFIIYYYSENYVMDKQNWHSAGLKAQN